MTNSHSPNPASAQCFPQAPANEWDITHQYDLSMIVKTPSLSRTASSGKWRFFCVRLQARPWDSRPASGRSRPGSSDSSSSSPSSGQPASLPVHGTSPAAAPGGRQAHSQGSNSVRSQQQLYRSFSGQAVLPSQRESVAAHHPTVRLAGADVPPPPLTVFPQSLFIRSPMPDCIAHKEHHELCLM